MIAEPLPKDSPEERRETLFRLLEREDKSVNTAIISDQRHIFYFSGFSTWRPRHSSFLAIRKDDEPVLFLGSTAAHKAESTFDGRIVTFEDYELEERMVAYGNYVSKKLYEFVRDERMADDGKCLAIEGWQLADEYAAALEKSKASDIPLLNISETILKMRKTKGKDELNFEREASRRLAAAYKTIKKHAISGETELGLYAEANADIFRKFGSLEYFEVSNVFGDYISGERTEGSSGGPTNRHLRRGDLLILDLQASDHHHWVDTCRTYLVGGTRPTAKQGLVFNAIMKARRRAELLLRPGTKASEVFKAVSNAIVDAGFKPIPHHAGHGLGLEDQEPPFFLPNSDEVLEEGVVCAVEPGIYDKDFGGMRIEDNYIITNDGFEDISKFPIGFP